jgi:hypothetical protein
MFEKIQQSPWTPWVIGFTIGLLLGLLIGQEQGRDHRGRLGRELPGAKGQQHGMAAPGSTVGQVGQLSQIGQGQDRPLTPEEMGMQQMESSLEGKTGDEFDKVFLEEMIAHHQGAVNMASVVLRSAKHNELKTFAQSIIDAQSKEIATMEQWIKDWGYGDTTASAGGANVGSMVQE